MRKAARHTKISLVQSPCSLCLSVHANSLSLQIHVLKTENLKDLFTVSTQSEAGFRWDCRFLFLRGPQAQLWPLPLTRWLLTSFLGSEWAGPACGSLGLTSSAARWQWWVFVRIQRRRPFESALHREDLLRSYQGSHCVSVKSRIHRIAEQDSGLTFWPYGPCLAKNICLSLQFSGWFLLKRVS